MAILYFDNEVVGATDGHLVFFLDSIEVLEREHPRRRFVAMLAVYATEIAEGQYPGPYRTADAQDFARCMLMPPDEISWRSRDGVTASSPSTSPSRSTK